MLISHEVLVKAVGLSTELTTKNRRVVARLHEFGIMIEGTENRFPKILRFSQIVPWKDLESPVAGHILELVFDKIAKALEEAPVPHAPRTPATAPSG